MTSETINKIYELLSKRFGEQYWWPGESVDEIIVGAILTQNTNWGNVEKAIGNLKQASVMSLAAINAIEIERLAELIRPAGYYNVKAKRIKNFLAWFFDEFGGDIEQLKKSDCASLRVELLSINGIGRETADSILLYGLGKAIFVIDTYTFRIAYRHGLIDDQCDYEELQRLFEDNLPCNVKLFNEYHALLVRAGKEFCKPKAKCSGCPLECLPHEIEQE
ncbi:MAG: hypothetical protein K8R02_03275 [Anaerohalosphaeraceae bacterium]|nr:hypothetical protein [Anaerohalosphaeraceae bacterium]